MIPTIHVGCRGYSAGRLQALVWCKGLEPVACVDLDLEAARESIRGLSGDVPAGLSDRVYRSIGEARARHDALLCLIYASTVAHASLVVESLELGMHTLCVKPMALDQSEFRRIAAAHRRRPELMLAQGQNNRWNPAAVKMREYLQGDNGIGEMLGGECRLWGRQDLRRANKREADATTEGLFFHSAACHQLDQLVAAKGLPKYVTALVHSRVAPDLDLTGVWGTAGGQALFQYANGACFSYTGTRAGHADPYGLGSRWTGRWTFHGSHGDLRRDGGHLELYRDGRVVEAFYLQDLHPGLVQDDLLMLQAVADALATGQGREWLQESSIGTWLLMEACNESARRGGERIEMSEFRDALIVGDRPRPMP
jgi:predicted dehydrogenase